MEQFWLQQFTFLEQVHVGRSYPGRSKPDTLSCKLVSVTSEIVYLYFIVDVKTILRRDLNTMYKHKFQQNWF